MAQAIPYVIMGTTAALGAASSVSAGNAAKNQANFDAATKENQALGLEQNVDQNKFLAAQEIERMRASFSSMRGQNVVNFASSGVELGSGSVATIQRQNMEKYLDDEYMFKFNEAKRNTSDINQANNLRTGAIADRIRGKYAKKMGKIKAATSLLGAASQMYGMSQMSQINTASTTPGEIS
tara:strand:+ start:3844 stop:4386 length:543 start_codon:yes stop_codon:yes gene_type:complete